MKKKLKKSKLLVSMKGLEPLRTKASDFKSDVSTISPHRHWVLPTLIII